MPPIEIPELGDEHHRLWCDLIDLETAFPGRWTIIGAHMVALYAWEAGVSTRPSTDVDILVNVRLASDASEQVSEFLMDRDYKPEMTSRGIVHLFKRGNVRQIDVFVPEGLGRRANRRTVRPNRTINIPGGTQALHRSGPVEVRSRDSVGTVSRPDLLGAILIKVRAVEVDDVPDAQRRDVALLLGLVQDPDSLAEQISSAERGWLRRHRYFADPTDPHWDDLDIDDRELPALVYGRLLRG